MTLLIDMLLFLVLFLLYCIYRKFRGKRVHAEGNFPKSAICESEWGLLALLIHVYQMDATMFKDHCSGPALLFLKLHKFVIILLTVLTVIALTVLMPVYHAGTASVANDLNRFGFSSVRDNDNLVIGPLLCLVLFSALAQFLLYTFFKLFRERNFYAVFSDQQSECTLQVFGLDRNDAPETSEQQLQEWMDTHFPNAVVRIEVVPEFSKAYPLYLSLKDEQEKLKLYRMYERE